MVTLQELIASSLAQTDALTKLLIEKGIITQGEFMQRLSAERISYKDIWKGKNHHIAESEGNNEKGANRPGAPFLSERASRATSVADRHQCLFYRRPLYRHRTLIASLVVGPH